MEEFFLDDKVNDGIKVPLHDKHGNKTEHFLTVISTHSEKFQRAEALSRRKAATIAVLETDEERSQFMVDKQRELIAHLVVGWSFEQDCTHANVVNFFKKAPQIQDVVDQIASRTQHFFN